MVLEALAGVIAQNKVEEKLTNTSHTDLGHSGCESFHNIASRRSGCMIAAVFEAKKEIPVSATVTREELPGGSLYSSVF
jgi:hypothetical protein